MPQENDQREAPVSRIYLFNSPRPALILMAVVLPLLAGTAMAQDARSSAEARVPDSVAGGTFEPNYRYPWMVSMAVPRGADPSAMGSHRRPLRREPISTEPLFVRAHGPLTGEKHSGELAVAGPSTLANTHIHPGYVEGNFENDIALVRLVRGFTIDPYIQTVALPTSPAHEGVVGVVGSLMEQNGPGA